MREIKHDVKIVSLTLEEQKLVGVPDRAFMRVLHHQLPNMPIWYQATENGWRIIDGFYTEGALESIFKKNNFDDELNG